MPRSTRSLRLEVLEHRTTPTFGLDPTFGTGGIGTTGLGYATLSWSEVGTQAGDRVVVYTGYADAPSTLPGASAPSRGEFLRFNPDGSLDPTFGTGGRVVLPADAGEGEMVVAPDGHIYLAISHSSANTTTVYRLNPDGTPDTTYGTDGAAIVNIGGSSQHIGGSPAASVKLALSPDGKVVVVGTGPAWTAEVLVARLNTDGSPDTTFNGTGLFQYTITSGNVSTVTAAAVAPDGTLIISGEAEGFPQPGPPGTATPAYVMFGPSFVLEVNPDGSLDTNFNGTGVLQFGPSFATPNPPLPTPLIGAAELVAQPNGKLLVLRDGEVDRVNPDGSPDPTFGTDGVASVPDLPAASLSETQTLALLPDGRIALETVTPTQLFVSVLNADGSSAAAFPGGAESFPIDFGGDPNAFWNVNGGLTVAPDGRLIAATTRSPDVSGSDQTELKLVALDQQGGTTVPPPPVPPREVTAALPPPASPPVAVGSGPGGGTVRVYDPSGNLRFTLQPFGPGFTGGVSVAVADVTGTGHPEIVVGAGAGGGPVVVVYDGTTGAEVERFFAFDPSFRGGVNVAVGDVTGAGRADIVVGAGAGGGPAVAVFDAATGQPVERFFAFDPGFTGGVSVAVGDVTGRGHAEVVVGAGAGGGPAVAVFDPATGAEVERFFAFDPGFTGGVNVAVGELNGTGTADLVVGAGPGGGPLVKVFDAAAGQVVGSFLAYDPGERAGVRVGVLDTGTGSATLVTADGTGRPADPKAFGGETLAPVTLPGAFMNIPVSAAGMTTITTEPPASVPATSVADLSLSLTDPGS